MEGDSAVTETNQTPVVDTELSQLNISDQLRANSSFMKIMATLFHYGNQSMNAAQLVIAVRALNLLPLRGETPKSTIQGIISTSRKIARDLKISDPFRIDKDGSGRQAKYAIADELLNGVETPEIIEIPDEPIILRPVEYTSTNVSYSYANQNAKRQRKQTSLYTPSTKLRQKKNSKSQKAKKKDVGEIDNSDVEVDSDEEYEFTSLTSEEDAPQNETVEEDTISNYSLLYSPPTSDLDYIDKINFTDYPIAGHFAIVQQKGYSYPRFRSHEKIKIPKLHCEDKFRVTDILKEGTVVGRLFILADGHGGPGCSEYFVRETPAAVDGICSHYSPPDLGDPLIQQKLEKDIKRMIQELDDRYLASKRQQLASRKSADEHIDNDGCTLILNIFLGEWLINVNVGDSRTVLISAPEPSTAPSIENTIGIDNDYKMDVVFASQDHKPYLEHLARHILENGGEFVDSVQNRVIKVELDKLREDGNRHTKRIALKNARIRPKDYQAGLDQSLALAAASLEPTMPDTEKTGENSAGWATQSAIRTTVSVTPHAVANATVVNNAALLRSRLREDRIPSLNVARSCGDLDFKMDPQHKIISCEPDVTFIRISDQPYVDRTILKNGPHKEKRRHFLFMSTDGTFDYMYEETAERQNRAIAKVIGPMIEDGEKIGQYLLEEEERIQGQTIEHIPETKPQTEENSTEPKPTDESDKKENNDTKDATMEDANPETKDETMEDVKRETDDQPEKKELNGKPEITEKEQPTESDVKDEPEHEKTESNNELTKPTVTETDDEINDTSQSIAQTEKEETSKDVDMVEITLKPEETNHEVSQKPSDDSPMDVDKATDENQTPEELPRIPLLHRELTEEEAKERKIKERTLVLSARYFANREGAHGFFSSTLQDYDDCTIILVEI